MMALALTLLAATGGEARAQINGPPIPADQILRQQNQPLAPPPSVPVPATPPSGASPSSARVPPVVGGNGQRVRDCQHRATVERVPRRQRDSYVHACIND